MQGRHETCRACGLDWNISRAQRMPARGYLCPRCAKREQRDTGLNRRAERQGTDVSRQ